MYRLLIADSEPDVCERIRQQIDWSDYGFWITRTATTYQEALDAAVELVPDIALVSIQLGKRWGYELVGQLHRLGMKTICCMTAQSADPDCIQRSMRASARDYLLKPLDSMELKNFVERTLVEELGETLPLRDGENGQLDPVLKKPYSSLSKVTQKILIEIQSSYGQSLTLSLIADRLQMSSKYIGRVFRKDTGMKFSEYLLGYRMEVARRLLLSTSEKIAVIAAMVGYLQVNHFYIHFKSYFGVSPGVLRNETAEGEDRHLFERWIS